LKSGEVGGCKDDERVKFSYGSGIDCGVHPIMFLYFQDMFYFVRFCQNQNFVSVLFLEQRDYKFRERFFTVFAHEGIRDLTGIESFFRICYKKCFGMQSDFFSVFKNWFGLCFEKSKCSFPFQLEKMRAHVSCILYS